MTTFTPKTEPLARSVRCAQGRLEVDLSDGRSISVPLEWFPRLSAANAEQRSNWELIGEGEGIHWPDIDEDLSVRGLLEGRPAPGAISRTGGA